MIDTLTNNRNRTAAEIRHILSTHRSSMSAPGSATWVFGRENGVVKPNTTVDLSEKDKESLTLLASDLSEHGDVQEVHTNES